MSTWTTGVGQRLIQVHPEDQCATEHCVIHNPSEHHMRDWPTFWVQAPTRDRRGVMYRICPHEFIHPDPDDLVFQKLIGNQTLPVHICDGCCTEGVSS
jgi:hypothetical protein